MSVCTTVKQAHLCASDVCGLKMMFGPQLSDWSTAGSNWKIPSWPLESMQACFVLYVVFCGIKSFYAWVTSTWKQRLPAHLLPEIKKTVFLKHGPGSFPGFCRHSSDYHFSLINLNEAAFKKGCRCRNQIIPTRFFNVPEAIICSSECNIFRFFFFTHLHTLSLTD